MTNVLQLPNHHGHALSFNGDFKFDARDWPSSFEGVALGSNKPGSVGSPNVDLLWSGLGTSSVSVPHHSGGLGEKRSLPLGQPTAMRPLPEQLFDANAIFKVKTSQIAMHLGLELRNRLFRQLDGLLDAEEWDERDRPPTSGSFSTFLRMLLLLRPTARPGLGATDDGHLVAAWTSGKDQLTIKALENDRVSWVLFRERDGSSERASGSNELVRLPEVLAPYGPSIWFGDHD